MAKTKVFVDLDDTLIKTSQLKREMIEIISSMGVPEGEVVKRYEASKNDSGIPIIDKLAKSFSDYNVDAEELRGMLETMYSIIPEENLLTQRLAYLEGKYPRETHEYILITKGEPEIQLRKIRGFNLSALFDRIMVVSTVKAEALRGVVQPDEHFILVDDKGSELKAVRESNFNAELISSESIDDEIEREEKESWEGSPRREG